MCKMKLLIVCLLLGILHLPLPSLCSKDATIQCQGHMPHFKNSCNKLPSFNSIREYNICWAENVIQFQLLSDACGKITITDHQLPNFTVLEAKRDLYLGIGRNCSHDFVNKLYDRGHRTFCLVTKKNFNIQSHMLNGQSYDVLHLDKTALLYDGGCQLKQCKRYRSEPSSRNTRMANPASNPYSMSVPYLVRLFSNSKAIGEGFFMSGFKIITLSKLYVQADSIDLFLPQSVLFQHSSFRRLPISQFTPIAELKYTNEPELNLVILEIDHRHFIDGKGRQHSVEKFLVEDTKEMDQSTLYKVLSGDSLVGEEFVAFGEAFVLKKKNGYTYVLHLLHGSMLSEGDLGAPVIISRYLHPNGSQTALAEKFKSKLIVSGIVSRISESNSAGVHLSKTVEVLATSAFPMQMFFSLNSNVDTVPYNVETANGIDAETTWSDVVQHPDRIKAALANGQIIGNSKAESGYSISDAYYYVTDLMASYYYNNY